MNYDDRTVVEYAERRLKARRSQKLAFPIMGALLLGAVVGLIWLVHRKSARVGESLFGNEMFLDGFVLGLLSMGALVLGAFGLVKMLRMSWGIEAAVYELAARLGREKPR